MPSLEKELKNNPPWIVGVLNITPDSFSDGGKFIDTDQAIKRGLEIHNEGADIIEIGGEATGKNSFPISVAEEIQRISNIVEELSKHTFVAIDTYKAETAEHCLRLGAKMINDVSGLRADPKLAEVIAKYQAFAVIMHSKETSMPHVSDTKHFYRDLILEISDFFRKQIAFAIRQGIDADKIILDPGMGMFLSEDPNVSWELLNHFSEFSNYEFDNPLMIATSRKSFLGGEVNTRDFPSLLTALLATFKGAKLIRTHNVAITKQALNIYPKIFRF
jgi:dihydropteroate synthase